MGNPGRKPIEVTCALIIENGKVLATQRSEGMQHPLKWEFPGGKVNQGETPAECIRREIREELGIEVQVIRRLPPVFHTYPSHRIRMIPFLCRPGTGTISLSEHRAFRWVPLESPEEVEWLDADLELVCKWGERLMGMEFRR